jgi:hypothetical protein
MPSVDVKVFEDNLLPEDLILDDFEHVLHLVVDEFSHRDANCSKSVPRLATTVKHWKLTNGVKLF